MAHPNHRDGRWDTAQSRRLQHLQYLYCETGKQNLFIPQNNNNDDDGGGGEDDDDDDDDDDNNNNNNK